MSPRLLVVDDDATILALLRRYFRGLGWQVEVSQDAEQGLGLAGSKPFDAVLCDLHLGPGHEAEGLEVVSRFHHVRPDAAVLLFTAAVTEGVKVAARQAGAADVLGKPTPLAELRDAVLRAMKAS